MERQSAGAPWWYRVPGCQVAVVVVIYTVAGIVIFTVVSELAMAWAGGGLALGLPLSL